MREDWVNFSISFLWLCKGLDFENGVSWMFMEKK